MVFEDCLFIFIIKIFFVVVFFKKVVGIEFGFGELNCNKVVIVKCDKVCEIVEIKMFDLNVVSVEVVMCMVEGVVCSMGIVIED